MMPSLCPSCNKQVSMWPDDIVCATCIAGVSPRLGVALAFLNQLYRRSGNFFSSGETLFSYAIPLAAWVHQEFDPRECAAFHDGPRCNPKTGIVNHDPLPDVIVTTETFKLWKQTGAALSPTTEHHMEALDQALAIKLQKDIA